MERFPGSARGGRRLPFEILYEDRDVIVIDKPAGLLTTHTKVVGRAAREAQLTAENLLNDYVRKGQLKSRNRVWLVHRLDRETSGVMMFAKSEEVAEYFRANWNGLTEKTYVAKVQGEIKEQNGVFESFLQEDADGYRVRSVGVGGSRGPRSSGDSRTPKFARTEWKLLSSIPHSPFPVPHSPFPVPHSPFPVPHSPFPVPHSPFPVPHSPFPVPHSPFPVPHSPSPIPFSLVEVFLKSGRKNQIRVHFSEAGHPVVGDVKYGGPKSDRLYLHAFRLRFRHPHTDEWMSFESPSPF